MLPGDTVSMRPTVVARTATPLFPLMDRIWLDTHWFFIPYRLLWNNFQKFMGEETDPGDSNSFNMPRMDYLALVIGEQSLADYMGLPVGKSLDNDTANSMPFRAYNLVYNEWYRDQDLQDSVVVDKDDGPDATADYSILKRGKRHDYFTACRPNPQKSDAGAVTLPLGTSAPLVGTLSVTGESGQGPIFDVGSAVGVVLEAGSSGDPHDTFGQRTLGSNPSVGDNYIWNDPNLEGDLSAHTADLTGATAATINQIREAVQLQRFYEKDARGGTRYTEILRNHFGVVSADQRLQRPEFCGASSTQINFVPVPRTATETASDPLGDLAAFGIAVGSGRSFTKSFTEHGYLMGIASTRADLSYQQGVEKLWSRQTRVDHYWPVFSHLGEQAVLNKEIFYNDDANDNLTFGYQERWAEYRHKQSRITGKMRSDASASLNAWHLSIDFSSLPSLNAAFITEDPAPVERALGAPSEPHYIANFWFQYRHTRPMPTYSVPGLMDHF